MQRQINKVDFWQKSTLFFAHASALTHMRARYYYLADNNISIIEMK